MHKLWISVLAAAALTMSAGAQSSAEHNQQQATGQQASRQSSQKNQPAQQGSQAGASASAMNSTAASANAGPASANLDNGTAVNANLLTTIDAGKVHPGQRVEAKTTKDVKEGNRVVMHRGTRLIGHVTEAQAHTKANAESSVGIVFDQAVEKGQTIPFHASIQALAAAQSMADTGFGDDGVMASGGAMGGGAVRGGGGLLSGAGGAVGSTAGMAGGAAGGATGSLGRTAGGTLQSSTSAAGSAAGSAGGNLHGLDAAGNLTSSSSGVFGMKGLNLTSSATSATEGSVMTSANRNVHLSSGTQMLLKTNSQAGRGAQSSSGQHPNPSRTPNGGKKQ